MAKMMFKAPSNPNQSMIITASRAEDPNASFVHPSKAEEEK